MKKYLKYGLWAIACIGLLLGSAMAYVALTFDPNEHKAEIIQAVQERTHRTLKLDGNIGLTLFPGIGVHVGGVSLSEFEREQEFAFIGRADLSLSLWPLLTGQLVVDQVELHGLKLQVVKQVNGHLNLDDLLGKKGEAAAAPVPVQKNAPFRFDVAAIRIDHAEILYRDEASGVQYQISDMQLKTGRIANALPSDIEFAAHLQFSEPKVDVLARLKGKMRFDLGQDLYQMQDIALQVNGAALDIAGLDLKATGEVEMQPAAEKFSLKKFTLAASGTKEAKPFEAHLDVPEVALQNGRLAAADIAMNGSMERDFGKLEAALSVPAVESNLQEFRLNGLSLKIGMKQSTQAYAMNITTAAVGNLQSQQYNLTNLEITLNAIGAELPGGNVTGELKGGVQADLQRQSVQANFSGKLQQSQIKAKAGVNNFRKPQIRYDLEIDQLDVDPFLPKKASASAAPDKTAAPEQRIDLSFLKPLLIEGSLRVGALKAANIKLGKLRIDLKAREGVATIAPLSCNLYQGNMAGKVVVDANANTYAIEEHLTGVDVGPLLRDVLARDMAEGKGDVVLALKARGQTVSAIRQSLQGKASVNLANGAIKGIDLAKLVQGIQRLNKDSRPETMGVNPDEKTAFSEFKASFNVNDGVAHNDDLAVKSTILRLTGSGDIDLGQARMDYHAKAIIAKTDQGGTGTLPVNVSGPFDALKIRVDYGALLTDLAKQKVDEKKEVLKENAKTRLQDELKKGLKGLFK